MRAWLRFAQGVRFTGDGATTSSMVMRLLSGTTREVRC